MASAAVTPSHAPEAARQLREALEALDLDRTIAHYAEDAVLTTPEGTYRGVDKIRAYHAAIFDLTVDLRLEATGVGIVPFDGGWVDQHVQIARFKPNTPVRIPTTAIHRTDADGKLARVDLYYDNWGSLQQLVKGLTGLRGVVARALVASISRGLRSGMPASD
jgi:hypothetical protein